MIVVQMSLSLPLFRGEYHPALWNALTQEERERIKTEMRRSYPVRVPKRAPKFKDIPTAEEAKVKRNLELGRLSLAILYAEFKTFINSETDKIYTLEKERLNLCNQLRCECPNKTESQNTVLLEQELNTKTAKLETIEIEFKNHTDATCVAIGALEEKQKQLSDTLDSLMISRVGADVFGFKKQKVDDIKIPNTTAHLTLFQLLQVPFQNRIFLIADWVDFEEKLLDITQDIPGRNTIYHAFLRCPLPEHPSFMNYF